MHVQVFIVLAAWKRWVPYVYLPMDRGCLTVCRL